MTEWIARFAAATMTGAAGHVILAGSFGWSNLPLGLIGVILIALSYLALLWPPPSWEREGPVDILESIDQTSAIPDVAYGSDIHPHAATEEYARRRQRPEYRQRDKNARR